MPFPAHVTFAVHAPTGSQGPVSFGAAARTEANRSVVTATPTDSGSVLTEQKVHASNPALDRAITTIAGLRRISASSLTDALALRTSFRGAYDVDCDFDIERQFPAVSPTFDPEQ